MIEYRLQYFDRRRNVLAINWAHNRDDYVSGDFYVRAIRTSTDVDKHNKDNHQRQLYTIPMSLDRTRTFIDRFGRDLCGEVHDCKGLVLEDFVKGVDESRWVNFDNPVQIRNMS